MNACRWSLGGALRGLLLLGLLWGGGPLMAWGQEHSPYLQALRVQVPMAERRVATALREARRLVGQYGMPRARAMLHPAVRMHDTSLVEVYVDLVRVDPASLEVLRQHGVEVVQSDTQLGIVYARVPMTALESVAALPVVRWLRPPSYSRRRAGSVRSEGDSAMRANIARAMAGVTGAGVRVGIISDSLVDLGTSVNSGDLPANVTIVNGQNGAGDPDANDEGRAMAEIIHDLAPGATLLFHTGFPTSLNFVAAVRELTAAGAHVIVDDLGFFNEPVFEEGQIAQAVRQAINQGVVYVSATGNDAQRHYQGMYREFAPNDGDPQVNVHDFGGGSTRLDVRIGAHALVVIFLQWPNPFDGSATTADYDMLLVDAVGNTLAISNDVQQGTQAPPLEAIVFLNPADRAVTAGVVINRVSGAALPLALHFNTFGNVTVLTHNVAAGSVFGHPCVRDVVAVGAVDANDPGFDTLEEFSAQGPCDLFFPTREFRTKPDLAGADGVMTSLPEFTPFFGTSAAAPHVAAVAALLLEAAGGPGRVSNTRVANTLRIAAVPRSFAGVNNRFGHGVVDAALAVQTIRSSTNMPPQSVIDAPGSDSMMAPNTPLLWQGHCVDAESDSPLTFAWDFGAVAPPVSVQNPGLILFPTEGVFRITLTCTDARGLVDPSPAVRTITVNTPPESVITSPADGATVAAGGSLNFAGACSDTAAQRSFTFLWNFGGGAIPSDSTQQAPGLVTFTTPGMVTVSFACTDEFGAIDPSPATLQVTVIAARTARGESGGGGGGCTLSARGQRTGEAILAILGNLGLPVLTLLTLYIWRRRG